MLSIFWDFRVSNHCWAFQVYFDSKPPSNHLAMVTTLLYSTISIYDLIVSFVKKKYQQFVYKSNIQDTIQVFQIWHNLCSELTSMWTFKMYSHNTKTSNEPTASNNKSDRPQVNIWDTWKTLKYLNMNDYFHLKDLEISKYKRESKALMPIKFYCHDYLWERGKGVKVQNWPHIILNNNARHRIKTIY